MADTTYTDYVAPAVNAEWLNEVNDHLWSDTPVAGTTVHGSDVIEFTQAGTGAVATTVQAELRREVWVEQFGAVGDGITDDTAAFKLAHDALPSTGGTIRLAAKTYILNKTVQADQFAITKSNVTLQGSGWGTILKHTATGVVTGNQAVVMIRPTGGDVSNTTIRDLKILGPTTNTGAAIFGDSRVLGILIHDGTETGHVDDTLIENVMIDGMETACFGITSGATKYVRRVNYSNCWAIRSRQDGFNSFTGGAFDVTINGCYAIDLDGFGMEMASAGNVITNNTIKRTGQSGIGMEYNATLGAAYRTLIANNNISDITTTAYPNASGISLGQSANPFNTEVRSNNIYRTGGSGVVINLTARDITVGNNTIVDVGKNNVSTVGISTGAAGTNLTIADNIIRRVDTANYNLTYGIALSGAGSVTNFIKNNEVQGATISKITANSPTRIIRSNPGKLNRTVTGNVGVGEDNLISATVDANTLQTDLMSVRIKAWGSTAANANNKTVKLYWGPSVIATTGALASNAKDWVLEAIVLRVSATVAEAASSGQFNGAIVQADYQAIGGQDFTADITVKCTGEATSDNDIVQNGLLIEFMETQ